MYLNIVTDNESQSEEDLINENSIDYSNDQNASTRSSYYMLSITNNIQISYESKREDKAMFASPEHKARASIVRFTLFNGNEEECSKNKNAAGFTKFSSKVRIFNFSKAVKRF
jgi:hypothetical protein